ncbi:MAG: leucine-rich repeat protein [Treponema sp.]|nr:leucine-rich repeat protein [Treponema sp.]
MESYYNLSQIYSLELRLSVEGDYSAVYEKVYSKNIMPENENTAPSEFDQNEELENFFLTALRKPIVIDDVPAGSRVRVRLYGCISVTLDIDSFRNMLLQDGEPEEEINNKLENLKELLSNSEENPIRFEGESEEILVQEGDNPVNIVWGYNTENQGDDPEVEELNISGYYPETWSFNKGLYLYGTSAFGQDCVSSAKVYCNNVDKDKFNKGEYFINTTDTDIIQLDYFAVDELAWVNLTAKNPGTVVVTIGNYSYDCTVKSLLYISNKNVESFLLPDNPTSYERIIYTIPSFIESIDSSAISDEVRNAIYEVDFSECGITHIPEYLFKNCEELESVSFPDGLIEIDSGAFSGCTSLSEVIYKGSIEQWNELGTWGSLEELDEVKLLVVSGDAAATYIYDSATGNWIAN